MSNAPKRPYVLTEQEGEKLLASLKPLHDEARHMQERAGAMTAVIAAILGIGLPLAAQQSGNNYFHLVPAFFMLMSFLIFYLVYVRTSWLGTPRHNGSLFLCLLGLTWVIRKKEPIREIVTRSLIWKRAASQWAHSFFITAIIMEVVEVSFPSIPWRQKMLQIIGGFVLALFIKLFAFASLVGLERSEGATS